MAFISDKVAPNSKLNLPHIDPAWMALVLVFSVLVTAAFWSDHVVDHSLEDWHGNVLHQSSDPRH